MKHIWPEEELIEHFTLSGDERKLLENKSAPLQLGFAALLKFFQYEGRFPLVKHEIPKPVIRYIARFRSLNTNDLLNNYNLLSEIEEPKGGMNKR